MPLHRPIPPPSHERVESRPINRPATQLLTVLPEERQHQLKPGRTELRPRMRAPLLPVREQADRDRPQPVRASLSLSVPFQPADLQPGAPELPGRDVQL